MSMRSIREHARKHLSGRGHLKYKNGHNEAHGIYACTVILTTQTQVEIYHAWSGGGAIAMHKARTELLPKLPLFS